MKNYKIAVLEGDGIGPEVTQSAIKVLEKVAKKYNFTLTLENFLVGGASIDKFGEPLTEENFEKIKQFDSILLGAVGGPKWDNIPKEIRPEVALFKLRGGYNLFANLRPIMLFDALKDSCPLKPEIIGNGLDLVFVRELTGGVYFGKKWTENEVANDVMTYSKSEVERIVDVAIKVAKVRNNKITSVDKANVLDTSRLWRKIYEDKTKDTDIDCNSLLVDNMAMQLIRNPKQFDVIVTSNLFGDILSDEASQLTGSIGMLPSASIGETSFGMYEPIHGSAPDIANQNIANPLAQILSVAMMLKYTFNELEAAKCIEKAVNDTLNQGHRTKDIAKENEVALSTTQITEKVLENI